MTTSSESDKPRSFLLAAVWAAGAFVVFAAFMFCMIFIVPRFEKEALEQKMKLPWALELTVAIARLHVEYSYLAGILIFPICLGLGALVAMIQPQGKLRTGCWLLWLVGVGVPAGGIVSFIVWHILTLQ